MHLDVKSQFVISCPPANFFETPEDAKDTESRDVPDIR